MSAWFVWGSLGMYPITGIESYMLASPLFPLATIHLPGGDLTVVSANGSQGFVYGKLTQVCPC